MGKEVEAETIPGRQQEPHTTWERWWTFLFSQFLRQIFKFHKRKKSCWPGLSLVFLHTVIWVDRLATGYQRGKGSSHRETGGQEWLRGRKENVNEGNSQAMRTQKNFQKCLCCTISGFPATGCLCFTKCSHNESWLQGIS